MREKESEVAQSCPTLCDPMDCSPPGSSVHGILLSKSTRGGCHFLLQMIFLTQGLNPGLLHCRQMLYHLSCQGSPTTISPDPHLMCQPPILHGGSTAPFYRGRPRDSEKRNNHPPTYTKPRRRLHPGGPSESSSWGISKPPCTTSAEPGALLRLQAAWRGDRNLAGQSRRELHTFGLLLRLPAAPGLSPHTWQVLKCRLGQGGAPTSRGSGWGWGEPQPPDLAPWDQMYTDTPLRQQTQIPQRPEQTSTSEAGWLSGHQGKLEALCEDALLPSFTQQLSQRSVANAASLLSYQRKSEIWFLQKQIHRPGKQIYNSQREEGVGKLGVSD